MLDKDKRTTRFALLTAAMLLATSASCDSPTEAEAPISFGRRQVDQMLADRPDMAGVLDDDDSVLLWIIESLNGGRIGQRIYWCADSISSGSTADHSSPTQGYPGLIRISGGTETTPVDKWASVVYELFNLENSAGFEELGERAIAGTIDGDEYAEGCLKLEYEAVKKTAEFFKRHKLPKSKHGNDTWYNWVRGDLGDFVEHVDTWKSRGASVDYNPLKYYRDYYDSAIVPYIELQKNAEHQQSEEVSQQQDDSG